MNVVTSSSPQHAGRVGMIGGGQLARMSQEAASRLGIALTVLDTDANAPAVDAGARWIDGSYRDLASLQQLATDVEVVTFDHELADPQALTILAENGTPVRPAPVTKRLAQDKLHARTVLGGELGFPVPAFARVVDAAEVAAFAEVHGWPVMLKAIRGGYDGRGLVVAGDAVEATNALTTLGSPALAEAFVAIDQELAVIVARSAGSSAVRVYPTLETVQKDGVCREVIMPARVDTAVSTAAQALAVDLAHAVELEGLMAVELFRTGDRLTICELALRPHNSGHVTLDGCVTSQFEQHLRAVLGWPLGPVTPLAPAAAMVNVLGPADGSDPMTRVAAAVGVEGAYVHMYGKAARPGRKLGHVTALGPTPESALGVARAAARILEGTT